MSVLPELAAQSHSKSAETDGQPRALTAVSHPRLARPSQSNGNHPWASQSHLRNHRVPETSDYLSLDRQLKWLDITPTAEVVLSAWNDHSPSRPTALLRRQTESWPSEWIRTLWKVLYQSEVTTLINNPSIYSSPVFSSMVIPEKGWFSSSFLWETCS